MAVVHKLHKEYSAAVLSARSLLHQCRVLFQRPPVDTAARRLRTRFEHLEAARPERITGRHVFLSDCYDAVKEARGVEHLGNCMRLDIMKKHGLLFAPLPVAKRMLYEARADTMSMNKRLQVNLDMQHTEALISLQSARRTKEKFDCGALQTLMSNSRFSDMQIAAMTSLISSEDFAIPRVLERRNSCYFIPGKPSLNELAALDGAPVPAFEDAQADHRPDWVKQICQRRDHFTTCGIQGLVHGQLTSFAILYAVQRPYHIGLCRLERQGRAIPLFGEMPMAKQARFMHDLFDFDFILQVDQLLTDRDVHFDEGEDLQVLMHLEYRPACQVCSHFDTVPLSSFCSKHRATKEPKQSHGEKHGSSSRKLDYELLATFPWLERYMAISELSRPSSSSKTSRASSVPAPELDPDELELAWDQLDLRRREWADEDKYVGTDFETVIRGGAWTHAAKGMAYDCIMARSSSEVGSEFVEKMACRRQSPSATPSTASRPPIYWHCIGLTRCSTCSTSTGTATSTVTCSATQTLMDMSRRGHFRNS